MRKQLVISRLGGRPINMLVDHLLEHCLDIMNDPENVSLPAGAAPLLADGDKQSVKLIITYDHPDCTQLKNLERVIAAAKGFNGDGADEIEITLT
jgi:hypothetical protein